MQAGPFDRFRRYIGPTRRGPFETRYNNESDNVYT